MGRSRPNGTSCGRLRLRATACGRGAEIAVSKYCRLDVAELERLVAMSQADRVRATAP